MSFLALIAAAWKVAKPFLKQFGPYLLALAIALTLYGAGCRHGSAEWKSKHDALKLALTQQLEVANATAQHNADEWSQCTTKLNEQNVSIADANREWENRVKNLNGAHARALLESRVATNQAIEAIQRDNAELRKRMRTMTPVESCNAAWLEVFND